MPEPMGKVLHFKSFDELQEAIKKIPHTTKPEKQVNAIEELLIKSEEAIKSTDIEFAYIYLSRVFIAFENLKKLDDFKSDSKYYRAILGRRLMEAMSILEGLDEILRQDYKSLNAIKKEDISIAVKQRTYRNDITNISKLSIGTGTPNGVYEMQPDSQGFITCEELFKMINSRKVGENKTLVIDLRSREDFNKSRMEIQDIINIPRPEVGLTGSRIEKDRMEPRFISYFKKRGDYDWVILADWLSDEIAVNRMSPVNVMMEILTVWDNNVKYKRKPIILKGGYDEWLWRYPTYCTNPSICLPQSAPLNIDAELESINYNSSQYFLDLLKDEETLPLSEEDSAKPMIDRSTKPVGPEKMPYLPTNTNNDDSDEEKHHNRMKNRYNGTKSVDNYVSKVNDGFGNDNRKLKEDYERRGRRFVLTSAVNQDTKNEEGNRNNWKECKEEEETSKVLDSNHNEGAFGIKRCSSTPNISKLSTNDNRPPVDRSTKPSNDDQLNFFTMGYSNEIGRGLTGLRNLGNTCYMNSIIQCLSNTEPLRKGLCSMDTRHVNERSKTRGAVARSLRNIISQLWNDDIGPVSCRELKAVIGEHRVTFREYEQQDSHEFLTILIDWLHEDLKEPARPAILDGADENSGEKAWGEFASKNHSLIRQLFYGQLKSTVHCTRCEKESIMFEPFSNLSLPLPTEEKCTLAECLNLYVDNENIPGWQCPDCKTPRDATKRLDITRLPPILVIHFKRFTSGNLCRKRLTNVEFPSILDMSAFIAGGEHRNKLYKLYAISNHFGSMESGHYTAYCVNAPSQKWYKFDDPDVTSLTSFPKSSSAYIVFYQSMKN